MNENDTRPDVAELSVAELSVAESGRDNATTLVFLHGLGVSGWMWSDQIEQLETRYHCLNVDLPGNGDSYQSEWRSFADTADRLAELIRRRAHGGRAHVVGLSLGGYAALHLLEHHPDVVETMVVSGVSARPFGRASLFRLIVPLLSRALRWNWVIALSARLMQLPEEVIPLYRRDSQRLSPVTIRRVYAEVLSYDLPEKLSQLEHRVLAVAGDAEVRKVKHDLSEFPSQLPRGCARLAPGAHHGWNAEHPELFTAMVEAWVEGEELPSALIRVGEKSTVSREVVAA